MMEQGCCTMRDIKLSKKTTTGLMKKWPPGKMNYNPSNIFAGV